MKKVQRLIVLILALAMCFSLAACGSSGTQQPAQDNSQTEQPTENKDTPAGEIVINFPCIWVGTDSKAAYLPKMVEDFNAENAGSIKVVIEEQTDYQAYRDKIRTTITTGSAPDICILDTTFDIQAYQESGKFMDLTSYLADGRLRRQCQHAARTCAVQHRLFPAVPDLRASVQRLQSGLRAVPQRP